MTHLEFPNESASDPSFVVWVWLREKKGPLPLGLRGSEAEGVWGLTHFRPWTLLNQHSRTKSQVKIQVTNNTTARRACNMQFSYLQSVTNVLESN